MKMLLAAGMLVSACRTATPPRWRYDADGSPRQYKRYARNMEVNYFPRFTRRAFDKIEKPLERLLGDNQVRLIEEYGQPEYRRPPFLSRDGEQVEEWVYLQHNKLFQFVLGHLVYEGEVTDMERTMIRRGYPNHCIIGQVEPETELFMFVYSFPFDLKREVYAFANGRLLFRQTHR